MFNRSRASRRDSSKNAPATGTNAAQPLAEERVEIGEERNRVADERHVAGERNDARTPKKHQVEKLLTDASHRDDLANRRDSAANDRDMKAGLAALLDDKHGDDFGADRGLARQDRRSARHDRIASADDRMELTTSSGTLSLPVSIPIQCGRSKPLMKCTPTEVADYSAQLLDQALRETRDAIEMVEQEGKATPQVKELLAESRDHQDDADDLLWYVNEWVRTGDRPQPASED
jgi:hypothetical protein